MLYSMVWSFRLHIFLLNSVALLKFSFKNEHTWFLYLNLNGVSWVSYVSLAVCLAISAWNIIFQCYSCHPQGNCNIENMWLDIINYWRYSSSCSSIQESSDFMPWVIADQYRKRSIFQHLLPFSCCMEGCTILYIVLLHGWVACLCITCPRL